MECFGHHNHCAYDEKGKSCLIKSTVLQKWEQYFSYCWKTVNWQIEMDFCCRLLAFLWASVELSHGSQVAFHSNPEKCYLFSKGFQIKWRCSLLFMKRCCHSSLLHIENKSLSPQRIRIMGNLIAMLLWKKVKTLCRMVDWRGASVTEETLERTEVSEARLSDAP